MTLQSEATAGDFHDPSNLATFFAATLAETDPELAGSIEAELRRQRHQIELIASENIVSRAVLEPQGSVLTNKYAEGYPGSPIVTHRLPVDDFEEGFQIMRSGQSGKVILDWM